MKPDCKKFNVTPLNFANVQSQPEGQKVLLTTPSLQITARKYNQKKNGWSKIFGDKNPLLNLEMLVEIYVKLAEGFYRMTECPEGAQ